MNRDAMIATLTLMDWEPLALFMGSTCYIARSCGGGKYLVAWGRTVTHTIDVQDVAALKLVRTSNWEILPDWDRFSDAQLRAFVGWAMK